MSVEDIAQWGQAFILSLDTCLVVGGVVTLYLFWRARR